MAKHWIFIFGLLILTTNGHGQGASLSESDLLKAYLEKRNGFRHSSTKEFTAEEQAELNELAKTLEENFPGSYSANLVIWINSGYENWRDDNLLAAYELDPDTREVRMEMLAYATVMGDQAKQKEMAGLIKSQYGENTLDYFRDLFPETGFVITSNQSDSYPLYVLQLVHSEGTGVMVINLELLQNNIYRTKIQKAAGMSDVEFTGNEKIWISQLLQQSTKPVMVSATVNQAYLSGSDNLYLTGLGYRYNVSDQYTQLEDFWNSVRRRDLSAISLSASDKKIYSNYLPALLTLYRLKMLQNVEDTMLRGGISALAAKINKTDTVDEILEDYETNR